MDDGKRDMLLAVESRWASHTGLPENGGRWRGDCTRGQYASSGDEFLE
nr:hypothetical protein [Rhodococcus sp. (in: high G+C Gram-positive bacteria)]